MEFLSSQYSNQLPTLSWLTDSDKDTVTESVSLIVNSEKTDKQTMCKVRIFIKLIHILCGSLFDHSSNYL